MLVKGVPDASYIYFIAAAVYNLSPANSTSNAFNQEIIRISRVSCQKGLSAMRKHGG